MIANVDSPAYRHAVTYCQGVNDSLGDDVVHPVVFATELFKHYREEEFLLLLLDGVAKRFHEEIRDTLITGQEMMTT